MLFLQGSQYNIRNKAEAEQHEIKQADLPFPRIVEITDYFQTRKYSDYKKKRGVLSFEDGFQRKRQSGFLPVLKTRKYHRRFLSPFNECLSELLTQKVFLHKDYSFIK